MLTKREERRMKRAGKHYESNGIGTALYILGVIEKDTYVWPGDERVDRFLEGLVKTSAPNLGGVFVARDEVVEHLGIIAQVEPYAVFERVGRRQGTAINYLWELEERFSKMTIELYSRANSSNL